MGAGLPSSLSRAVARIRASGATGVLKRWEWIVVAVCVGLAIVPLPLGFIHVGFAEAAGFWGIYGVLPMLAVVALAMLLRGRGVRPGARDAFRLLVIAVTLPYVAFWLLWFAFPVVVPAWLALAAAMRA